MKTAFLLAAVLAAPPAPAAPPVGPAATAAAGAESAVAAAERAIAEARAAGASEADLQAAGEILGKAREARRQGRTEEATRNLLTVLQVRGIAVPDAARERILTQKDPERLERWLAKAVVATSLAEVLDEPS